MKTSNEPFNFQFYFAYFMSQAVKMDFMKLARESSVNYFANVEVMYVCFLRDTLLFHTSFLIPFCNDNFFFQCFSF